MQWCWLSVVSSTSNKETWFLWIQVGTSRGPVGCLLCEDLLNTGFCFLHQCLKRCRPGLRPLVLCVPERTPQVALHALREAPLSPRGAGCLFWSPRANGPEGLAWAGHRPPCRKLVGLVGTGVLLTLCTLKHHPILHLYLQLEPQV